jgi:hypothetical protein
MGRRGERLTESRSEDTVREQELGTIDHRSGVVADWGVGVRVPAPLESLGSEDVGGEGEGSRSEGDGEHDRGSVDFGVLGHELRVEDGVGWCKRLGLLSLSLGGSGPSVYVWRGRETGRGLTLMIPTILRSSRSGCVGKSLGSSTDLWLARWGTIAMALTSMTRELSVATVPKRYPATGVLRSAEHTKALSKFLARTKVGRSSLTSSFVT